MVNKEEKMQEFENRLLKGTAMKFIKFLSLTLIATMLLSDRVNALQMSKAQGFLQTITTEPQMRKINLKLPLKQPRFHWTFMRKQDFLAGKLILRIERENEITEIIIFKDGKISKGWKATTFPENIYTQKAGEIYFGFESSRKYVTEPNDILEIELHVVKDLNGIGAFQTGVLPEGIYKSDGTYSGLIDKYKIPESIKEMPDETLEKLKKMYEFTAFLENWNQQWELTITGEDGWLPPDKRKMAEKMIEKVGEKQK